ncbi:unnamed protein product [Linum tenue]|uniref:Uncharacterized protein n=1 Tax=Linum tenue TaxID=586396 RepID=A0AAV0H531_9ROSI|nr:unnamed protein product [Linum tenue]
MPPTGRLPMSPPSQFPPPAPSPSDCPLLSPCLVSVTNGRPQLSLPFRFPPSFSNSLPSPCPVLSLSPQHPNLRRYHRSISNNSVALLHGADDGRSSLRGNIHAKARMKKVGGECLTS